MAGVNAVTKALAKAGHPEVELVRGDGYHYFVFDNSHPDGAKDGKMRYLFGADLIYETESIMTAQFRSYSFQRWVEDGIAFAEKVKEQNA